MAKMTSYFRSNIGTKQLMGVTGLALCGFLIAHLAGNLLLLKGQKSINDYAKFLHENPLLIPAEIALVVIFLVHVAAAIKLVIRNRQARPSRYAAPSTSEPKYWPSSFMGFTGTIVLLFVIFHLANFKFYSGTHGKEDVYSIVMERFAHLPSTIFYVVAMLCIGVHLFHGFQSSFLTLGLDTPKHRPYVKFVGILYAIAMTVGFAIIPIYCYAKQGGVH